MVFYVMLYCLRQVNRNLAFVHRTWQKVLFSLFRKRFSRYVFACFKFCDCTSSLSRGSYFNAMPIIIDSDSKYWDMCKKSRETSNVRSYYCQLYLTSRFIL